jgi:hypothetical protein
MVEYDPSLTDRVVTALHRFVKLSNRMLRNGEGVDKWAQTRWEDYVVALQWYVLLRPLVMILHHMVFIDATNVWDRLYDNHPRGEEELLIDTMKRLKWSGVPWDKVLSEEVGYFLYLVSMVLKNRIAHPQRTRYASLRWHPSSVVMNIPQSRTLPTPLVSSFLGTVSTLLKGSNRLLRLIDSRTMFLVSTVLDLYT